MKNKIFAVMLAMSLALTMAACGADTPAAPVESQTVSEETTSTADEAEAVVEEKDSKDNSERPAGPAVEDSLTHGDLFQVYSTVLEDAFNVVYVGTEPTGSGLGGLKAETTYMEEEQKNAVGYVFDDINDDGTPELIIGCTNCSTSLYALYTYDNSGIMALGSGGYRTALHLYEQGYFVCEGSSGAAYYSYDIYKLDGTERVLKDFFFTDFRDEEDFDIGYFHNKTGEWDKSVSEELTEEAFAVCSEIGLEMLDYSDKFTPLYELGDYFGGVYTGISIDDLDGEYTWVLSKYVEDNKVYSAEVNDIIQYMNFTEGHTVNFYRTEKGKNVIEKTDIEYEEFDNQIWFYYTDYETGYSMSVYLYRIEADDTVMTQRFYYDDGGYHIINEYYMRTVG